MILVQTGLNSDGIPERFFLSKIVKKSADEKIREK